MIVPLPPRNRRVHTYKIKTPPTETLAVSLAFAKEWLKITDASQDAMVTFLIRTATIACEKYCRAVFFSTTFTTYRDYFNQDWELLRAPLYDILEIRYLSGGASVVYPLTAYKTNIQNPAAYGYAYLMEGQTWPTNMDRVENAVEIDFIAGYADTMDDLPETIQLAVLQAMTSAYQNRGDCAGACAELSSGLPAIAAATLSPYRTILI